MFEYQWAVYNLEQTFVKLSWIYPDLSGKPSNLQETPLNPPQYVLHPENVWKLYEAKMDVDLLTFRMFGNGEKVYQEKKTWIEFKFSKNEIKIEKSVADECISKHTWKDFFRKVVDCKNFTWRRILLLNLELLTIFEWWQVLSSPKLKFNFEIEWKLFLRKITMSCIIKLEVNSSETIAKLLNWKRTYFYMRTDLWHQSKEPI